MTIRGGVALFINEHTDLNIRDKSLLVEPGGGTLNIIWCVCAMAHPKRGGVLGTGTTRQKWVS